MKNSSSTHNSKQNNRLKDNVILIINGLCESGRVLAEMLAEQGSNVVIVASHQDDEMTQHIRRDVKARGSRCLILTPDIPDIMVNTKKPFSQYALQIIVNTFGRLDAFISFSDDEATDTNDDRHACEKTDGCSNGRVSNPRIFDEEGLTKAALRHILNQTN